MAGLVMLVRAGSAQCDMPRWPLAAAMEKASVGALHSSARAAKRLIEFPGFACSSIHHVRDESSSDSATADGLSVARYGQVRWGDPGGANLAAADLLDAIRKQDLSALDQLSGSYQLVVSDRHRGEVIVQNDRQGTLPLYFCHGPGWCAFAPEAKCFFKAGLLDAELDQQALLCFLREGFLLPQQSVFKHVVRLQPAQRIHIQLNEPSPRLRQYWHLDFDADHSFSLSEAASQLYDLVLDSHQRETSDAPSRFGLFLTGGIDSRGIADALASVDRRPSVALTWCGRPGLKNSDPDIAARIASYYGYDHRVVALEASEFATHAQDWVYISELTTDNPGFMLGSYDRFQQEVPVGLRYMLVGDELFGHGYAPKSLQECARYVLKSAFHDSHQWLRGCLQTDAAAWSDRNFSDQVTELLDRCTGNGSRDALDWLTYHVHRPCWSFSPGNCKEPGMPVRRPFLQDEIVHFMTRLPPGFRNDKLVYHEMLRLKMPVVKRFPRNSVNSLFDWPSLFRNTPSIRQVLRDSIQTALDSKHVVGLLDRQETEALVGSYFAVVLDEGRPQRSLGHHAVNLRRLAGRVPLAKSSIRKLTKLFGRTSRQQTLSPTDVIRRLSLVGMLVALIDNGDFAGTK